MDPRFESSGWEGEDTVIKTELPGSRKGGKPSPGTPADGRLKQNKPKEGGKKPFPGAAPPFKGGKKDR